MRGVFLAAGCVAVAAAVVAGEAPVVDDQARTVTVPAVVAKQGTYEVLKGAIEYVLVAKGGKEYEALFVTDCSPADLHQALLKLGLAPGEPAKEGNPPKGPAVRIGVECEADGKAVRRPADEFVLHKATGKPLEAAPWAFTGSTKGFDPQANQEVIQAALTKSLVGLHHTDPSPLLQNPRPEAKTENIYAANLGALPPAGTAVRLVFERVVAEVPAGTRRVHLFLSGRVQGVGFRAFTQLEARRLKLAGWVKNLADGRVEAVVEGPKDQVEALLQKLQRGPRAARVERLDAKDEPPGGDLGEFEIRY